MIVTAFDLCGMCFKYTYINASLGNDLPWNGEHIRPCLVGVHACLPDRPCFSSIETRLCVIDRILIDYLIMALFFFSWIRFCWGRSQLEPRMTWRK